MRIIKIAEFFPGRVGQRVMVDEDAFRRHVEECQQNDNGLYAMMGLPELKPHHFEEVAIVEQVQSGGSSALIRFRDGKTIWLDAKELKQAPRRGISQRNGIVASKAFFDHIYIVSTPEGSFKALPIPKHGTPAGMVHVRNYQTGKLTLVRMDDCTIDQEEEAKREARWDAREMKEMEEGDGGGLRMPVWAHPYPQG